MEGMGGFEKVRVVYLLGIGERGILKVGFVLTKLINRRNFDRHRVASIADILVPSIREDLPPEDRHVLTRLLPFHGFRGVEVEGTDARELLKLLLATKRAFLEPSTRGRVNPADPPFVLPTWKVNPDGTWCPGWKTDLADAVFCATLPPTAFFPSDAVDRVAELRAEGWPERAAYDWTRGGPMEPARARAFAERLINRYPGLPLPDFPDGAVSAREQIPAQPVLTVLRREGSDVLDADTLSALEDALLLRVRFDYGGRLLEWTDEATEVAVRGDDRLRRFDRDKEGEEQALARLKVMGFAPKGRDPQADLFDFHANDFRLPAGAPETWETLLGRCLPALERDGWRIDAPVETFRTAREAEWYDGVSAEAGAHGDNGDWFHFEAGLVVDGRRIAVLPLMADFLRRHRNEPSEFLRTRFRESSFAVRDEAADEWVVLPSEKLLAVFDGLFELRAGRAMVSAAGVRVSAWRARELLMDGVTAEAPAGLSTDTVKRLRERAAGDLRLRAPDDLPPELNGLRDYQRQGLSWMEFLRETGTSGILADDMGLGKTFQVLAHLHYLKKKGLLTAPALVVAPVSVLANWMREAELRAPALAACIHHGPSRAARISDSGEADLWITSHALLRQDADVLAGVEWSVAVIDEAQAIKNRQSATFQAALRLRAPLRLALSGTPVENRPAELWSLFEFVMPGFLGAAAAFDALFAMNGEDTAAENARTDAMEFTRRRIAPFVLRRRKEEVARELPAKTEINHFIALSECQALAYETIRARCHAEIQPLLEERGAESAGMVVLAALARLRMICCDPRIGTEGNAEATTADSAKLLRFLDLLDELLEEGRKVLVFSQFVGMLDLIAGELKLRGREHFILTGKTPAPERARLVEAFNYDAGPPVFLISLKAGGVGLNLTGADTVIHYDPWWNPATEDQATDRAHRIGQNKPVFVHRLFAEGTVEEKIRALHARKRAFAEALLGALPTDRLALDEETINELLSPATAGRG